MFSKNQLLSTIKKKRGSLTPAIALLLAVVIALGAILSDYASFAYAKPCLQRSAEQSLTVALCDYNEDLYQHYHLYALDDSAVAAEQIKATLELLSENQGLSFNRYQIATVNTDFSGDSLANIDNLRQMIIENHSKAFVADKAISWLERMGSFKNFVKITDIMQKFSELLTQFSELDYLFNLLRDGFQLFAEFRKLFNTVDLEAMLKLVDDTKDDYQSSKEALEDYLKTGDKTSPKAEELRAAVSTAKREYQKSKKSVRDFLDKSKTLAEYIDALIKFQRQLDVSIKMAKRLKNDVDVLARQNLDDYSNKALKRISEHTDMILNGLDTANDKLDDSLRQIKRIKEDLSTFNKTISQILEGTTLMPPSKNELMEQMAAVNMPEIELLKQKSDKKDYALMYRLGDILFNSGLKAIDHDFGSMPDDVYSSLPSRQKNIKDKIKKQRLSYSASNFHRSFEDKTTTSQKIMTVFTYKAEDLLEKMVLVDYLLEHFSYAGKADSYNKYFSSGECEYLLFGQKQAGANILATEAEIFGIRMVLNAISIFSFKQVELQEIATTLSEVSGMFSYPVWLGLSLLAWSGLESYVDIMSLRQGGTATLIKFETDIRVSLTSKKLLAVEEMLPEELKQATQNPLDFDYRDYLFLLLLAKNEDKLLLRTGDLLATSKAVKSSDISQLKTLIKLDLEAEFYPFYSGFTLGTDLPITAGKTVNYHIERGY